MISPVVYGVDEYILHTVHNWWDHAPAHARGRVYPPHRTQQVRSRPNTRPWKSTSSTPYTTGEIMPQHTPVDEYILHTVHNRWDKAPTHARGRVHPPHRTQQVRSRPNTRPWKSTSSTPYTTGEIMTQHTPVDEYILHTVHNRWDKAPTHARGRVHPPHRTQQVRSCPNTRPWMSTSSTPYTTGEIKPQHTPVDEYILHTLHNRWDQAPTHARGRVHPPHRTQQVRSGPNTRPWTSTSSTPYTTGEIKPQHTPVDEYTFPHRTQQVSLSYVCTYNYVFWVIAIKDNYVKIFKSILEYFLLANTRINGLLKTNWCLEAGNKTQWPFYRHYQCTIPVFVALHD